MKHKTLICTFFSCFLLLFSINARSQEPKQPSLIQYNFVSQKELEEELCSVPFDNQQRESFMAKLFIQAGAKPEEIQKQAVDISNEPAHNIYVVKPGKTKDIIVIGGHLDHVFEGRGIIDDWTGVCAVTNIYQTIKDLPTNHTIVFIGFADEEKGLLVSKTYVRTLEKNTKALHKAMINLECLGIGESLVWSNGSDKVLVDKAHSVAKAQNLSLSEHTLYGVGADSNSFREVGIPAITIDGLPKDKFSFIHSSEDKCENVNQKFYYDSYRLAVSYLLEIDKITNPLVKN